MNAGDADGARLGMQTLIKRRADRKHSTAGALSCFKNNDLTPRLPKDVGGSQSGEARTDHDDRDPGARGGLVR